MGFYEEMQDVASEVMAEFKQGVVEYVQITPGNGPVTNPGPATEVKFGMNTAVNGVAKKYVDLGLAVASDLQCVAAVDARYNPRKINSAIDVDGVRHKITQILPKPAAGTPVAFLFIIQRGGG